MVAVWGIAPRKGAGASGLFRARGSLLRLESDQLVTSEAGSERVYTGSVARRFCASFLDFCLACGVLELGLIVITELDVPVEADLVFVALFFPGTYFILYLCELFFRRTLGMLLFGLIVLPPRHRHAWAWLLIRKVGNFIEFSALGGLPYYFPIAFSSRCLSLSDMMSGCRIARAKYVARPSEPLPAMPPFVVRILLALAFGLWVPLGTIYGIGVQYWGW